MAIPVRSSKFDLLRWIQSEGGLQQYIEWRDNMITRMMIDGLAAMNSATKVPKSSVTDTIDPLSVAEINGFRAGRDTMIELMLNLDDFHVVSGGEQEVTDRLKAYLTENEGFSDEDAAAALAAEEGEV